MRTVFIILTSLLFSINHIYAKEEKKVIPPDINWEQTNDRDISYPLLYQSESNVYVYSEKQLDTWFYQDEAIYNEKSYAFNRKIFVITPDRT